MGNAADAPGFALCVIWGGVGGVLVPLDAALRRLIGIFLGLAKELVELAVEDIVFVFLRLHRFLEGVLTAAGLALEDLHGGFHVGDFARLFRGLKRYNGLEFGIDRERRLAAGAGENEGLGLGHMGNSTAIRMEQYGGIT